MNRLANKDCLERNELTAEILEKQLMFNFERHYKLNKAPFIINIETSWFKSHGEMLTEALIKFVNALTSSTSDMAAKSDIYLLGLSKIVEWIQYPAPMNVIASKWLWDCDGSTFDYDEECQMVLKQKQMTEELEEIKMKNKTIQLDLQAERLFHNGVLSVVIAAFFLATVFTICFDKYA